MGIAHLHFNNIVHRDLACRNLLMCNEKSKSLRVVVSDFGFSRQLDQEASATTKSHVGPVRWMAPEAILNKQYSGKSDVWAFGALIYELMEEKVPYSNHGNLQVAVKVTSSGLRLTPESNWPFHLPEVLKLYD
eukprot:UN02276